MAEALCPIERRLVEWAEWSRAGAPSYLPSASVETRALERGGVTVMASAGDGGMLHHYQRQRRDEEADARARQLQRLVHEMPAAMRDLVRVTYTDTLADVLPRRAAALRLGVNEMAYRVRKAQTLAWIAGRLGMAVELT